jgi:serine/threonine protein kinase
MDKIEPANIPGQSHSSQPSPFSHDPYLGLPVIGNGMTGIVLKMGEGRAVKKAKQYQPGHLQDREDMEYMNEINQQILENEIQVFERLGSYKGIIPFFQTSQYGIELALAQGNLESYLETYPERENSLKISWMSSLIDTFAHVHSHKVFVDDIALRNILILDEQLKLADFGQSILLPPDIDITSANENDLNVQIEILHLGWVLYSIASWRVHKYYFFSPENPDLCWPEPDSFPNVHDVLCGKIIKKCWRGEYASMDNVKDEAHQLLSSH